MVDVLHHLEEGELLEDRCVAFLRDVDPEQADGVRDRHQVDAEEIKRAHGVAGADRQQHAEVADLLELLQRVNDFPGIPVLQDNVQIFLRQELGVGDPGEREDVVEACVGVNALHDLGE